jgi:hypothetical protein
VRETARGCRWGGPPDGEVRPPELEVRDDVVLLLEVQSDDEVRPGHPEQPHPPDERVREVDVHADADGRLTAAGAPGLTDCARQDLQGVAGTAEERMTGGRQRDPAGVTLEQLDPELTLEALELLGQRGLRQVQATRCSSEVELLREDDEGLQQPRIDGTGRSGRSVRVAATTGRRHEGQSRTTHQRC